MKLVRVCPQCRLETDEEQCPVDGFGTVSVDTDTGGDPLIGSVFQGRYRIHEQIGRGGFGAVYRATQIGVGREVAVKVLSREAGSTLSDIARFQQEARALATLEHPGIVAIYDFGQSQAGTLFMVMELLRGYPLDRVLRDRGPLSVAEVVDLAVAVVDALAEAHAAGIVHRDLKPANIFIASSSRGRSTVKLLDFGIARVSGEAASQMTLTKTGQIIGSPPYMSPEQCAGHPITSQTDLYSLGCILYEALVGRPIFAHTSTTAWLIAHCTEPVEAPPVSGELEGELSELIVSLLEKDPERRPRGVDEVAARLAHLREQIPVEGTTPSAQRASRVLALGPVGASQRVSPPATGLAEVAPKRRPRVALTLGLLAVGLVTAGALAVALGSGDSDGQDAIARAMQAPASELPAPTPTPVSSSGTASASVSVAADVAPFAPEPPAAAADVAPLAPELPVAAAAELDVAPASDVQVVEEDTGPRSLVRVIRLESVPPGRITFVEPAGDNDSGPSSFETPFEWRWTEGQPLAAVRFDSPGYRGRMVRLTSSDIERGELRVVLERLPQRPRPTPQAVPPSTDRPSW